MTCLFVRSFTRLLVGWFACFFVFFFGSCVRSLFARLSVRPLSFALQRAMVTDMLALSFMLQRGIMPADLRRRHLAVASRGRRQRPVTSRPRHVTSPLRLEEGGCTASRHRHRHVTVTPSLGTGAVGSVTSRQRHVTVTSPSPRHGTVTSSLGTGAVGSVTVTVTVTSRRRRLVVGDGGSRQRHGTSPSRHRHVTRPRGGPCSIFGVRTLHGVSSRSWESYC